MGRSLWCTGAEFDQGRGGCTESRNGLRLHLHHSRGHSFSSPPYRTLTPRQQDRNCCEGSRELFCDRSTRQLLIFCMNIRLHLNASAPVSSRLPEVPCFACSTECRRVLPFAFVTIIRPLRKQIKSAHKSCRVPIGHLVWSIESGCASRCVRWGEGRRLQCIRWLEPQLRRACPSLLTAAFRIQVLHLPSSPHCCTFLRSESLVLVYLDGIPNVSIFPQLREGLVKPGIFMMLPYRQ